MAIPNTPVTREEVYLDAIATGDASGLPAYPVTREEMYLDAIAKGGGGGSSGGVLVVHGDLQTNALDKTWQEISDANWSVLEYSAREGSRTLCPCYIVATNGSAYVVQFADFADGTLYLMSFVTDSPNGYPVMQGG